MISFRDVLWAVASEDGMVCELDGGPPLEAAHRIAYCITRAYRYALEFYDWPEATIFSQAPVGLHPQWHTPFIPRVYQESHPPDAFPVFDFGRLYGLWTTNPAADPQARALDYRFGPDGLYLDEERETVVLHHRQSAPRFSAVEWEPGMAYPRTTVVYHAPTGHCYMQNAAQPGEEPAPFKNPWRVLPLLECLREPTVEGAYALLKRSQGQTDTAKVLEHSMQHLLEQQILQLTNQEQQTKFYKTAA